MGIKCETVNCAWEESVPGRSCCGLSSGETRGRREVEDLNAQPSRIEKEKKR